MNGSKLRRLSGGALCIFSLFFSAACAGGSEASYISFQVPGAMGTYPMSINNFMTVTGYYYASATLVRGFVRQADGLITTFDAVGSAWTEPEGINDAGEITGYYLPTLPVGFASPEPHAFLRYPNGRIVTFSPPCDGIFACGESQPVGINAFGEVVGTYPYGRGVSAAIFTRSRDGSFTNFNVGTDIDEDIFATAINAEGTYVGILYSTQPFDPVLPVTSVAVDARGYVVGSASISQSPDSYVPYDAYEATILEGINNGGTMVGWFVGCNNNCATGYTQAGFLESPDGIYTMFNPPGTIVNSPRSGFSLRGIPSFLPDAVSLAAPHRLSINTPGSVTGSYTDTTGAQHGFVRNPYGTITSFDPPRGVQTTATSINDSEVITGTYFYRWNAQIAQAFLRIPGP
jgi:hypothetical protein